MQAGQEGLTRKYPEGMTSMDKRIRLFLLIIRRRCCMCLFRNKNGKTNEADSKLLEVERNHVERNVM